MYIKIDYIYLYSLSLKAGIYDFLYVFNCNTLIKYVTITQNRQQKLHIKAEFHKMQQRTLAPRVDCDVHIFLQ
jgi:hypothetical protein